MSWSAWAAITKYHRLGGLNNRHLFSHSSAGWKSEIRVSAQSGSGEVFLPDLQMATFLLCPHVVGEVGEGERESKLSL